MGYQNPIKIGVIGGGQLCRMMGEEIQRKRLPYSLFTIDPTPGCPAYKFVERHYAADFKDGDTIRRLASEVDVVTFEIELAGSEALESLARQGKSIHPSPETLRTIQDKYVQKTFLKQHGLPVPDFQAVEGRDDIVTLSRDFGYPMMLKARRDSYDGRGNYLIASEEMIDAALSELRKEDQKRDLMVERYVDFAKEVSVIAARSTTGEIRAYPVGENVHRNNILLMTIVPARISSDVYDTSVELAREVLKALEGAGVFGIEMFVEKNGYVLINEIAPRVHNSGHHTIEACDTSQFEQHLRAITGYPLGDTTLRYSAVMHNILGGSEDSGPYELLGIDEVEKSLTTYVHMYGKKEVRPERKMGHLTIIGELGNFDEDIDQLIEQAKHARNTISFKKLAA